MFRDRRRVLPVTVLLAITACAPDAPPPPPLPDQADQPPITTTQAQTGQADSAATNTAKAGEIDASSGLVVDQHWELVKAHCSVCHSTRLVTQNRADRDTWLALIRWMQNSQGLWQFDPATESNILDYLSSNYAPLDTGRRPLLDADLLPPNPWDAQ